MSWSPVPSAHGAESPDQVQAPYERFDEILGKGAFSVVYKGRHRLTGQLVAIKVFKDTDETRFSHTVKCFERLGGVQKTSSWLRSEVSSIVGGGARWSPPQAESEMASIRNESVRSAAAASFRPTKEMAHQLKLALVSKELIVSLLDYSRGPDGRPGKENGEFYVVMELGDISLEEYIDYRLKANLPLTLPEIRSILHDVTRMVCLLHSQGLAHLDVKPGNIMLFNSTFWKLIDFDGCFRAASLIDVTQTDIAFTPLYCAPEIGAVIVKMSDQLKISRLMDVWSVGAIGAELASMKPIFEQVYDRMYDSVNNDDSSFLKWLAADGLSSEGFRERNTPVDPELHSLLFNHMLVCDPRKRWSLPQVLKHPFFATVTNNKQTWTFPKQTAKVHQVTKAPRILTLHPSEMSIDLSNPLESDDALLLHDSSVDQDEHPGLSPLEITPMVSPQAMGNQKSFLRIFCCNSEQRTS